MKRFFNNFRRILLNFLTPSRLIIIAVVGIFFGAMTLGDQGIYQLERLLKMRNRLILERKDLNNEIDRLIREKAILSDPDKLEHVIRSELSYIKPGEVIFEKNK